MPRKRKEFRFRDPREQVASAVLSTKNRPHTFFYEIFPNDPEIRWWDNRNPGDVFDIIDLDELAVRVKAAGFLNIRVVDHLPGFCSLLDECPDHLGYH